MAFDLNKKEDENKKFNLSKTVNSTSKVDLAKVKEETKVKEGGKKNVSLWIFGILGLALVAIVVWYFLIPSNSTLTEDSSVVQGGSSPSGQSQLAGGSDSIVASGSKGSNPEPTTTTPTNPSKSEDESNVETNSTSNTPVTGVGKTENSTRSDPASASLNRKVPATFGSGSADLFSVDDSIVEGLITFLVKNPNELITLHGYASSDGDLGVNQKLSQNRADAFKKYLVSKGVAANRITAVGRGIENPVSSNDTESGRKENRRVEIIVQ